jgi:V/A-type H+-transporting ATPase subunit F
MSRLLIVTRPSLASGFRLAGVEAYAAASAAAAQQLIAGWIEAGESGLLAVDDEVLAGLPPVLRRRLDAAVHLPYVALPSSQAPGQESAVRQQMAELIRRTVGYHITFRGEQP